MVIAPELAVFKALDELRVEAAQQRQARAVMRVRRQARRAAKRQRRHNQNAAEVLCYYAAAHAGGQA